MGKFPSTKSIAKRSLNIKSGTFDMTDIYKKIKEKAEDLGYIFIEKEQGTKFNKYGQELKLDFYLDKEFDDFGKAEVSIILFFDSVHKLKNGLDQGDCAVKIVGVQVLDFNNRWGHDIFTRSLFNLYKTAKKNQFKIKYMIPIIQDVDKIYDFIKELFNEYHQN